ncbi:hypothetical protein O7635_05070 [Asanoa sp. WMMD1127]|uniref:hypothetical protein n=1 Tax=Asanoa sp. WMMD1127 TaxID=3016107 RepID=UPI00241691A2|nr:hypothetical protein [Asanoa sp. WMMD1127]MDG4821227.1 hypothetical protein [Asanoa sp. WMMD1127]
MELFRLAGLIAGVLAAWVLSVWGEPNIAPALAVPALAASLAAGLWLADRAVPRPAGAGVRTARLVPRRTLDLVPAGPAAGVVLLTVALGGLLGVTGPASTAHTRSTVMPNNPLDGRHIGCVSGGVGQQGPWPGWFYAITIGATLALVAAGTVVVLRRLVTRPVDDADRRATANGVVSALGVLTAVTLGGCAYFTHSILGQPGVCESPVATSTRPWLLAPMLVALAAGGYYAVRLVRPPSNPEARRVGAVVAAR